MTTDQRPLLILPDKPAVLPRMARAFSHAGNTRAVRDCVEALRVLGCGADGKPRKQVARCLNR